MNNYILIYVVWSIIVGLYCLYFWVKHEIPNEVKNSSKGIKTIIMFLVFLINAVCAPISLYELYKKNNKPEEVTK